MACSTSFAEIIGNPSPSREWNLKSENRASYSSFTNERTIIEPKPRETALCRGDSAFSRRISAAEMFIKGTSDVRT